jgi:peptide/nickel transport system permease protein
VRTYVIRRLQLMIPVILLITVAVASMMRMIPGDPATLALGESATEEDRARFRAAYHLDDPLPVQYLRWWSDVFKGDLGQSVIQRTSVTTELKDRLPSTIELLVLSTTLTVIFGVTFGVVAGIKQNTPVDYAIRLFSIGGLSMPSFWVGTLALVLPAIWWNYLPPLGKVSLTEDPIGNLRQYIVPAATLALATSASVMRMTRSSVLEVMRNDYVRTARSKGLHGRVIVLRHVIKNALIPVVTIIGLQVANLMGGTVIIETIFNLPGIGIFMINSINNRDYPSVQGLVFFLAIIFMFINLLVDLCYGLIDPRIRYS